MKIAIFDLNTQERQFFQDHLRLDSAHQVSFFDSPLTLETLPAERDFDLVSVRITSSLSKELLGCLPNLQAIATRSTGFDHIDIAAAKECGIMVLNVPAYGEQTVAEFTVGLLLNLSRKISQAVQQTKEKKYFDTKQLEGFDLMGKTLGLIGAGRIGRRVAMLAKSFGLKVIVYDVFINQEWAAQIGFQYVTLDELLAQSDIITLHLAYTPVAHHLINQRSIDLMKRGVYIINTSRGSVLDSEALLRGLQSGHIAGAALDVCDEESQWRIKGSNLPRVMEELLKLPDVIITPHLASQTREAKLRILDTTVANIHNFMTGKVQNSVG